MRQKIMIVDDEPGVVDVIKSYFEMEGYLVITAESGTKALEKLSQTPDLILLDINMPDIDGLTLCKSIRAHIACPILFLTARTAHADKLNGFSAGADDYILKPFDLDELGARVAAHLRRENRKQEQSCLRFFGDMVIDYTKHELMIRQTPIALSKKEFAIVELLSTYAGQVFDRERIYEIVWGLDGGGSSDTIMEHIRKIRSWAAPEGIVLHTGPSFWATPMPELSAQAAALSKALGVAQLLLPILIYIAALFATASMFYRLKMKEPLAALSAGASRIIENDLDFTLEARSDDDLGQLCVAFETMRGALLSNNRKLWRQAEERRRLNAAFSHNLRNPVTVLKGSAKLMKNALADDAVDREQLLSHLLRIMNYTDRIERYVETMSSVQRLEEIPVEREQTDWDSLMAELKAALCPVLSDGEKQLCFTADADGGSIWIDKSILFQIAENLASNALRFAAHRVDISCLWKDEKLLLSVTDDSCGFPAALLRNGPAPFQKGNKDNEHFGMGLYVCSLLAEKHGGGITIQNQTAGASVTAALNIQETLSVF